MNQEKLLSEQNINVLEFIQKQKHLEINEVVITKNVIKVKAVNDNDWDDYDWYPDSH
jgi:hypothetical protein